MKILFIFANKFENQFSKNIDNSYFFITGMGPLSGYSLNKFLSEKNDIEYIINIGICGCTNKTIPLFSFFSINETFKIENQNFKLDVNVLNKFNFEKASCCTVDELINDERKLNMLKKTGSLLFDMETFFLKQTADKYNIPFFAFKTVSDYGDFKTFNADFKKTAIKASSLLCEKVTKLF